MQRNGQVDGHDEACDVLFVCIFANMQKREKLLLLHIPNLTCYSKTSLALIIHVMMLYKTSI